MGDVPAESQGKRRGRFGLYRPRSAEGRRPHRVQVRMNDDEKARIEAMAHVAHISTPMLFMRAALGGDAITASKVELAIGELYVIRRIMGGAATNLNQIAKAANSGGEVSEAQVLAAADAIMRQSQRLEALLSEIPGGELYR